MTESNPTPDPREFLRRNAGVTQTQNRNGRWVEAIPLPFFLSLGRCQCDCKRKFWNREAYEGHYALVHILAMDPSR